MSKLNWWRIATYSVTLYLSNVISIAAITFIFLRLGYALGDAGVTIVLNIIVPCLISLCVFVTLALKQIQYLYIHAFVVYILTFFISKVVNWMAFDLPIFSDILLIIIPFQLITITLGTMVGLKIRGVTGVSETAT